MFVKKSQSVAVARGAEFRRKTAGHFTEVVRVLAVNSGPTGIPHVTFSHRIDLGATKSLDSDHRTLALPRFVELYPEPVVALP